MKILFCGTPNFAKTSLEKIYQTFPEDEIFVLSAPARKQGRGMLLTQPPVAQFAIEHNLPLFQPETLKDEAFLPILKDIRPDLAIVAAYGKILPAYFIDFPKFGCMNVHASLLPKYRGASPIQQAILDGNDKTGVTIMQMDYGLDTGDILLSDECVIDEEDNTLTLTNRLAKLGAELVCEAITAAKAQKLSPKKQEDSLSSYAKKIERADETIDFTLAAQLISCKIRALAPRPFANTHTPDGNEIKICKAKVTTQKASAPGLVRTQKSRVFVSCADYEIELLSVKPQGKGEMPAAALVNGRKISNGDILQ